MLLQQTIQILKLGARPDRDAALARPVENIRIDALFHSHGVDNRLHLAKQRVVYHLASTRWQAAHAWHLIHDARHATHILHLLDLFFEVFQVEALALLNLGRNTLRFLLIDLALNLFD